MADFFTTVFLLSYLFYYCFVLMVIVGNIRLKKGQNYKEYVVSILVAARNEEDNIRACIEAVANQNYPADKYEIIIINDRSTDKTEEIIDELLPDFPNISKLNITETPEGYSPKKFALSEGIKTSQGEILCFTDADCVPGKDWIKGIVANFEPEVGFVAGFSPVYAKNDIGKLFKGYLYTDALALAVSSAGGIRSGLPLTCAGRNLAYRKAAYDAVGGFENIKNYISGDDDLMLHQIKTKTKWIIKYLTARETIVPTFIESSPKSLLNQRTRHASKFRAYPLKVKAISLGIITFYISLLLSPVYVIAGWIELNLLAVIIASKFIIEAASMRIGAIKIGGKFNLFDFAFAFLIHPFLIVVFSINGARGKFTWKV